MARRKKQAGQVSAAVAIKLLLLRAANLFCVCMALSPVRDKQVYALQASPQASPQRQVDSKTDQIAAAYQDRSPQQDQVPASSAHSSPANKAMVSLFPDLFPAPANQPDKLKFSSAGAKEKAAAAAAASPTVTSAKPPQSPVAMHLSPTPRFSPQQQAQPARPTPADASHCLIAEQTDIDKLHTYSQTAITSLHISLQPLTPSLLSDVMVVDFPALRSLNISSVQLNIDMVKVIARCRFFRLSCLNLSDNALTTDAMEILGHSFSWSGLEHLDLGYNKLDASSVAVLIKAGMPRLQRLDLRGNEMEFLSVSELVKGKWPGLKSLSLGCFIGQDAIHVMIKEPTANKIEWPELEELDLSCNKLLDAKAMSKLIKGQWPWLNSLSLWGCGLDASAASKISKGNWLHLRTLNLSANKLGAAGIASLLKYQKWRKLEHLSLSSNKLDLAAFELLVKAKWDNLKHLSLSMNNLPAAILAPLKTAAWPALEVLDLSGNDITQADLALFKDDNVGSTLIVSTVRELNKLDPPGYLHFPLLRTLDLSITALEPDLESVRLARMAIA